MPRLLSTFQRLTRGMMGLIVVLLLGAAAFSCCFPYQAKSQADLETIARAVYNYRDLFNDFPPLVVTDAEGTPLHSWRVLIVPMVESNGFYDAYDLDSAWNGEANVDLRDGTRRDDGAKFPNPSDVAGAFTSERRPHILETIYVAVARGPLQERPFDHGNEAPQAGHYLSRDQSFIILEVQNSGIHWMEPRDVKLQLESFPEWTGVDDIRDQIVRSVEVFRTTSYDYKDAWRVRDREETLAYLDSLRERP
ncbi:DUF1559 domain-containing protein [Blastopirellula sp. JC732]|uniref:DUF1559 domain-containing protein n=1 Tax=Blastopirellula sediminis TaxID=2894196 RepID=A0A9X1MRP2_9BACT|nr:DUF1559 domain-containing protein [Blastopirellula sediminis]MCC9605570.1 DUF1559 domain-containing protein [Blastopirellula sediminis]MCC9631130.1 DUF1559 domain-containing protein [Blastopirellula sediminis]